MDLRAFSDLLPSLRAPHAAKGYRIGTHRTRDPAATIAAYWPLANRLGITRLAGLTGLDHIGIPVFTCIRPNARSIATSQGKGLDAASARASALMESIETWHAEHIVRPLRWASLAQLAREADDGGTPVIDVGKLVHVEGRTVARTVGRPWIEGVDLIQGRRVYVPFEMISLDFVSDGTSETSALVRSSNGLSSGNHLLEAIVHGLCEVIERDARALWIHVGDQLPSRLDLATVDDPVCVEILSRLERAGVMVGAWDITSDVGVPTYAAMIVDRPETEAWQTHGAYPGAGTHLVPGVALLRALTEAVQTRLTFIAGSRDDTLRTEYLRAHLDETNREYATGLVEEPATRSFSEQNAIATETFEGDVACILSRLQTAGFDSAVVVDLGRADIGIPVVRCIVPGAEHHKAHAVVGARARAIAAAVAAKGTP